MKTVVCGRWNRHASDIEEAKTLHKTREEFAAGKIAREKVTEAENALTKKLVAQLMYCGVDYIGDGQFRWDSIYDVVRGISGCSHFKQLARIPETNHFHRQPLVKKCLISGAPKLMHKKLLLGQDLEFLKNICHVPVWTVMCLPGPYSCARQTKNISDLGLEKLTYAYAEAMREELDNLMRGGALIVRIEEPQIINHLQDYKIFKEAMAYLTNGLDQYYIALATWFGSIKHFENYFDLPFGMFFVDFVDGKESLDCLGAFPKNKTLVAGIIDARHTYEETPEELKSLVDAIAAHVPEKNILLSTNTDLHFLPWNKAMTKVKLLASFAKERGE